MRIAVLTETEADDSRVAATPETVRKFIAAGASVAVQAGAGAGSAILDEDYAEAGADIGKTAAATLKGADLILRVRRPATFKSYPKGAGLIALMDPYGNEDALKAMADAGLSGFSLELIPRITVSEGSVTTVSANIDFGDNRFGFLWIFQQEVV